MLPDGLLRSPKLSRDLRLTLAQVANGRSIRVILRYRPEPGLKLRKVVAAESVRYLPRFRAAVIEVSPRNLSELIRDESVLMLWHDFRVHAAVDKAVPAVGGQIAWEHGLTGKGTLIAILDTGVDPDHPDLRERVEATRTFIDHCQDDGGAAEAEPAILDCNGHGTHVAGIAAGDGHVSNGRFRGIAPEANLLIGKVLDDQGGGNASDVIAGLEWALAEGAHVACLSLGGDAATDGTDALSVACDEFSEQGLLICAAAGNAGPRPYTIGSPGCAREVLTVGAVDLSGPHPVVARFSSRGPTADGRRKPDVVFPGVNITSCRSRAGFIGIPDASYPDYYCSASGTSMATPIAAGFCALMAQALSEATPRELKALLLEAARPLDGNPYAAGAGLPDFSLVLRTPAGKNSGIAPLPPEERTGCLSQLLPFLSFLLASREQA